MRTQQVECIVFRKHKTHVQYLLLKRIPKKGSFWQPPCGGVEKEDKSLIEATYREVQEETGITHDKIIRIIEDVYRFTMNNDYLTGKESAPLKEYVLGVEVVPDVTVKLDCNIDVEHEEYRWIDF